VVPLTLPKNFDVTIVPLEFPHTPPILSVPRTVAKIEQPIILASLHPAKPPAMLVLVLTSAVQVQPEIRPFLPL
jgi:hypothetical protein